MSRDNIFWGLILIVVGALFLARNYVAIDFRLLWPLFIIAFGVYILIGRTWGSSARSESEQVSVPLDGAKKAFVKIEHGAGRVRISGAAKMGQMLEGRFDAMRLSSHKDGASLSVKLKTDVEDSVFWFFPWNWNRSRREWDFSLSPDVPISLKVETGASDNQLDLSELQVVDLDLDTGASSTTIVLPKKAGHTKADISAGAASIDITIPKGVAARIRAEAGVGSINVDQKRFPRSGKTYESENYATAENTVDLRVQVGVTSVDIH